MFARRWTQLYPRFDDPAKKASEVHYRRLFENAKDGILVLDANTGQITDANPVLEEMLGYSHAELLGKRLWEIGPFRDIAASQDAFRELQRREYIRYDNLPLETKGHEQRQVEFVSNLYLANGQRVIQCIIRDVTARQRAEADLRNANDELSALVTALRERDREMQLLNRMHDLLQACTVPEEAYPVIARIGGELFAEQSGYLAIDHACEQHLETVARWGAEPSVPSVFSLDDCWAMRHGQLHEVGDPATGLLCHHFVGRSGSGYVCVPLMVQGEALGLLCLLPGRTGNEGDPVRRRQLAVTVGEAIKLSLANLRLRTKLRDQALHDSLTGLFNRRYLEESLPRELHRAQRENIPLCVVMLDLDHFKQFNDRLGHAAGDALLRAVGQVLREKLRQSDISCRYGGEEFALVLPDSSPEAAQQRVEEIRLLVRGLDLQYGGHRLGTVTLSAGIAAARDDRSNARDLLRAADKALYAAKQAGRDRVVVDP
jgi:diguanylate cyclase (GGDEF)-like protein/PAS domain S-box-containing protein